MTEIQMHRGIICLTEKELPDIPCVFTLDLIHVSIHKSGEKLIASVQNPDLLASLKEKNYNRYGDLFVEVFSNYLELCKTTINETVSQIQNVELSTLSQYSNRKLANLVIDRNTFTSVGISLLKFENDLRVLKNRHSELLEYCYERLGPIEMEVSLVTKQFDVYTKLVLTDFDLFASAISANLGRVAVVLSVVAVLISLASFLL